jgi:hypothetical protein
VTDNDSVSTPRRLEQGKGGSPTRPPAHFTPRFMCLIVLEVLSGRPQRAGCSMAAPFPRPRQLNGHAAGRRLYH